MTEAMSGRKLGYDQKKWRLTYCVVWKSFVVKKFLWVNETTKIN